MRPRISIRGFVCPSVRPSIRPSVRPSVRYACAKTAFFGCFRPRWDPTLNLLRDKHDLRASITTLVVSSVCLSICQSIYVTWSIYAETQSGRIVASSGLFLSLSLSLILRVCFASSFRILPFQSFSICFHFEPLTSSTERKWCIWKKSVVLCVFSPRKIPQRHFG